VDVGRHHASPAPTDRVPILLLVRVRPAAPARSPARFSAVLHPVSANDPLDVDLVRRLANLLATTRVEPDAWQRLRAAIEPLLDAHDETATTSPYALGFRNGGDSTDLDRNARHPIATGTTAIFPLLHLEMDGSCVVVRATFGPAFEGPPGLVHGGFVAAAFDMAVSAAASRLAVLNVTRRLEVRYLRPTFLGVPLAFAAIATAGEGRLIDVTARLTGPDDRLLARASAQCASLPATRFADRSPSGEAAPP